MIEEPFHFEAYHYSDEKRIHQIDYRCYESEYDLKNGVFIECIPMQFTGLKDKKGNDIYEGDIVKRIANVGLPSEDTRNWFIKWGTWCYMRYSDNENAFGFDAIDARSNCEVIGNIHQHPELLTQGA